MENTQMSFEERKEIALREARKLGIVDVVQGSSSNGVNLEALEQAIKLTREHAPNLHKELEERRKSQR